MPAGPVAHREHLEVEVDVRHVVHRPLGQREPDELARVGVLVADGALVLGAKFNLEGGDASALEQPTALRRRAAPLAASQASRCAPPRARRAQYDYRYGCERPFWFFLLFLLFAIRIDLRIWCDAVSVCA